MAKQFKDMNAAERDDFKIVRFLKRKAKAEAAGKVYKPRLTGNMKRLMDDYPERFTVIDTPPSVDSDEVIRLKAELLHTKHLLIGASSRETIAVKAQDELKGKLRKEAKINDRLDTELAIIRMTRNDHSEKEMGRLHEYLEARTERMNDALKRATQLSNELFTLRCELSKK